MGKKKKLIDDTNTFYEMPLNLLNASYKLTYWFSSDILINAISSHRSLKNLIILCIYVHTFS